jgi:hypothetical protein
MIGNPRGQGGVALLLTVAALAVVGLVSLTALGLARTEREAGLGAIARVQARGAADGALALGLLGWPVTLTPSSAGSEVQVASFVGPGPASATAWLRNLGGPVYLLWATGRRSAGDGTTLAESRMELLVLLNPADSNGTTHPVRYPRGWRLLP